MPALTFTKNLVTFVDADSRKEAESAMADVLIAQGYAKPSYKQAILDREVNFPTGLYVGEYNAAIPHCDPENVNEGAMCVGVMKHPVTWGRMEDKNDTCEVSLVVMLAITDPKEHLEMLRKVIGLIQDQELVGRVVSSTDAAEVYDLVAEKLA
jgi:PTS system galactitol-specific IIA component